MPIRAAIRWDPMGDNACISYVIFDEDNYHALTGPEICSLGKGDFKSIERILKSFMQEILRVLRSDGHAQVIPVNYKAFSDQSQYNPREDTREFHKQLKKLISEDEYLESGKSLRHDLEGDQATIFL